MSLMWQQSMRTGIEEVDAQHKKLIGIYNSLGEAIERGITSAEVAQFLDVLMDYATYHFNFEECCFEQYKCPFAAQNREAHADFVRIFEGIRAEFRERGADASLIIRIHAELSNWLITHITNIDSKLRPCVEKGSVDGA